MTSRLSPIREDPAPGRKLVEGARRDPRIGDRLIRSPPGRTATQPLDESLERALGDRLRDPLDQFGTKSEG
jgi:hypothetical protein